MERAQDPLGEEIDLGTAKCCSSIGWADVYRMRQDIEEEFAKCLKMLVGKLKTLADGSFSDAVQRKAVKDMMDRFVYQEFADQFYSVLNDYMSMDDMAAKR